MELKFRRFECAQFLLRSTWFNSPFLFILNKLISKAQLYNAELTKQLMNQQLTDSRIGWFDIW